MNEHGPRQGGSQEGPEEGYVSRERLEKAVKEAEHSVEASKVVMDWRLQELDRREKAGTPTEQMRIHLETAYTLRDVGMLNDAREMLEEIMDISEQINDQDSYEEAEEALATLPKLN